MITIISTYRPCKPSSPRAQTVYKQDTRALPIKCEPRSQFLTYAKECIQKKQEKGDLIIIGMDLNDPVQHYGRTHFFEELHMKEAILTTHTGTPPPTTNILNELNYPIDGI